MNGNMFVSKKEITEDDLNAAALKRVSITEIPEEGEETVTIIENAVYDRILAWPEGWLFNLREKSKEEQQAEEIQNLQEKNAFLEGCIMEMSEEVYK